MSLIGSLKYINSSNIKNALFHFRTFGMRSVLRKTIDYFEYTKNYNIWHLRHIIPAAELRKQEEADFAYHPRISIIVPVYKTPPIFLRQMIESVTTQTYNNWELCIADGTADDSISYITDMITEYQNIWPNIFYTKLSENLGISGNTNAALELASGDYIALLDHDDILTPDALFEIVKALNTTPCPDVLYTDEDKVDTSLQTYYDPCFKPDFNLDLLRSCNYITHFYVVKRELANQCGGFSDACNGSQDYDFILKTCDLARHIIHIPKVLYHWRIHPASVAGNPESKSYAYESALQALQNHLNRNKENALAKMDMQYGYYHVYYSFSGNPHVSIILKDCSSNLREQLQEITTYRDFDFADSPEHATGEYLIILYHAERVVTPNWIEQLLGNCSRSSVGIAAAKILYKKNRILESGLIFTPDGQIHSPFYKYYDTDTGYCFRAQIQQNCSLIGPYCFMIKKDIYNRFYKPTDKTNFSQTVYKLCHTLTEHQLSIVLLPFVSVLCNVHPKTLPILECYKGKYDPFYSPNFSQNQMYHLPKKQGS